MSTTTLTDSPATERRQFRIHPKMLYDVIQRQAGTLSKAILECIMNAVDAGASKCEIEVKQDAVTVVDNGKGFRSRKEIEDWFEVFGQPHEESENKVFGTFRMGRGQLFSFGRNIWRTGKFEMDVDILNEGLDYSLRDDLRSAKGCKINAALYKQLSIVDLNSTIREVSEWCKWCDINVTVNGKRVSKNPAKAKWDLETDDAYISLKPHGGLAVFNLGIHTMTMDSWRLGTGGEIVTKHQVKVNFARNDIQSDCEVWKRIKAEVDELAGKAVAKKKSLTDGEKRRLATKLADGLEDFGNLRDTKLITAVTGRAYSLDEFINTARSRPITLASKGSVKGDTIHRMGTAFVVADETLDRFGVYSLGELCKLLRDKGANLLERIVDFDELAATISDKHSIIPVSKLRVSERIWLDIMQASQKELKSTWFQSRNLQIGDSETRNGWTDGQTFIAVSRQFLDKQDFSIDGLAKVGRLLLHEYCHDGADISDHDHDQAFYEEFHDQAGNVGHFIERALKQMPFAFRREKKKINQKTINRLGRIELASTRLQELVTAINQEVFKDL